MNTKAKYYICQMVFTASCLGGASMPAYAITPICTLPPELSVSVTPNLLWPPNHKYVTVEAGVTVSGSCPNGITVTLVSVTSDEPDSGLGDGDQVNDIVIINDFTFNLRAERSGLGDGRIYTITYQATDSSGNTTEASALVSVPLNQSN